MAKLHAGLDVSLEMTSVCVVGEEDRICLAAKAPGEPAALTETLSALDGAFVPVGHEAGPLSQWLFFGLADGGLPAVCIETRRLKGAIGDGGEQDRPKRRPRRRAGGPVGMVRGGPRQVDREPGTMGPLRSWRS